MILLIVRLVYMFSFLGASATGSPFFGLPLLIGGLIVFFVDGIAGLIGWSVLGIIIAALVAMVFL
jgi:hypothetical protein